MKRGILSAALLMAGGWLATPADPPAPPRDGVQAKIRQLDDPAFAVRQAAARHLRNLGLRVVPQLREALGREQSPECRKQLQRLLADLTQLPWHTDTAEAVNEATRSGKPILAFSTIGEPCGFA